jgi:hypothetical protein
MNKSSARQGLEEGEDKRGLPEDMMHVKKRTIPDLPMRLTKCKNLRWKASKSSDLNLEEYGWVERLGGGET